MFIAGVRARQRRPLTPRGLPRADRSRGWAESDDDVRKPACPADPVARRSRHRSAQGRRGSRDRCRGVPLRRPRPGRRSPRRLSRMAGMSRRTPSRAPVITADWTRCAGPGGEAAVLSRGHTSPIAAFCAPCTRLALPPRRSTRQTRPPGARHLLADSDPEAAAALGG